MKIGLLFGSFNPVHTGHLVIANYMAEFTDLEQVWFILSPHNPLKMSQDLLQDYHRLELMKDASIKFVPAPIMEISATFIRENIRNKKDVRYMMPESVWDYIEEMHFYEK